MKLIGLYIENFGGLQKYSLNFEMGITSVIQPNGFGKTTLAEFIRAMFYGFPRKSKTLEKSLRQKYTPWGGGQFGGNLTFEYDGKHYRVERTFGANPKGDTFAVIDLETNRKTNLFPEELGQKLLDWMRILLNAVPICLKCGMAEVLQPHRFRQNSVTW